MIFFAALFVMQSVGRHCAQLASPLNRRPCSLDFEERVREAASIVAECPSDKLVHHAFSEHLSHTSQKTIAVLCDSLDMRLSLHSVVVRVEILKLIRPCAGRTNAGYVGICMKRSFFTFVDSQRGSANGYVPILISGSELSRFLDVV